LRYLFSTFPDEWPGWGLLLLRVAQALSTILDLRFYPWGLAAGGALTLLGAQLLSSAFLAAGLWTPIAGLILAVVESILVFASGRIDSRSAMVAVIALSLAMLGPGAWSIDARLFGKRRIDL
jgi:putative oxidoreductase